jgi:hypothetical protein
LRRLLRIVALSGPDLHDRLTLRIANRRQGIVVALIIQSLAAILIECKRTIRPCDSIKGCGILKLTILRVFARTSLDVNTVKRALPSTTVFAIGLVGETGGRVVRRGKGKQPVHTNITTIMPTKVSRHCRYLLKTEANASCITWHHPLRKCVEDLLLSLYQIIVAYTIIRVIHWRNFPKTERRSKQKRSIFPGKCPLVRKAPGQCRSRYPRRCECR